MRINKTIGISLSGGGARAAAHIGVLQALNENGIYPDHISGASGGAVIGALYCSGYSPREILELTMTHSFLKIFKLGIEIKSLTDLSRLKKFLYNHIKTDFAELTVPLHISLTNLNRGQWEVENKGNLIDIVVASCAIPLLFHPVKINGNTYVDGGVLNNLPVEPLIEACEVVVGSNVSGFEELKEISGSLQIAQRCLQLAIHSNVAPRLEKCDVVFDIKPAYHFGTFEIKKVDELYDIGYQMAIDGMDHLLELLEQ
ncbi:patatin-like phospholipase family protein [Flagellimonas beolgyonensis]|uniref:patatin-like phospholipase family protein n=1 Tax=Flagellimonas beolgyonensis TaxID=864064 RepID=UPI003D64949A